MMKKIWNVKKLVAALLVLVSLLTAALPAMAAAPAIKKVKYEGSGKVEVEFTKENVRYKSAKVSVKDENGKSYSAKITEKDDDELTFKVSGIAAGKSYSFVLSGVRAGKSGSYGSVGGSFKTPAAGKLAIHDVDYDHEDRELEVEFSGRVQYKSAKAVVKDASGKSYTVKILEKDSDSIELRVKGLTRGKTYGVQISGVRLKSTGGSYGSVSTTFVAR